MWGIDGNPRDNHSSFLFSLQPSYSFLTSEDQPVKMMINQYNKEKIHQGRQSFSPY
eukprot:jgi/Psemu1/19734/gm1.19734_g